MRMTLLVYFEDPFWIGVFQREEGGRLSTARVVFGAEPTNAEVLQWLLAHYHQLRFSPQVQSGRAVALANNPKRRQRQAAKAAATGLGTRAQQALQLQREVVKEARHEQQRTRRALNEQIKWERHQAKRKARHQGR